MIVLPFTNNCFLDTYKSSSKSARQKGKISLHLDLDNYRQNGNIIKIIYIKDGKMKDRMTNKSPSPQPLPRREGSEHRDTL